MTVTPELDFDAMSLMEKIALLDDDQQREILDEMTEVELADARVWLRPSQLRVLDDDAPIVAMMSGRGSGKSRTGASWAIEKARTPGTVIHLVGRTVADVRDVMVQGEAGIMAVSPPDFVPDYTPSLRRLVWPNGSRAQTFSADRPDQLRGPQSQATWADEVAAFRLRPDTSGATAWDNIRLSTRLGHRPQILVTTTPRRVPIVKELIDLSKDKAGIVSLHTGSTFENRANLAPSFMENLVAMYGGTALAEQELYGKFLEIVEYALWQDSDFSRGVVDPEATFGLITIIGVDPGVTTGGDATGVVKVRGETRGPMPQRRVWVQEDLTEEGLSPERWAARVVTAWREADKPAVVVAESNQGGELVRQVIKQSPGGEDCPVLLVTAKGSKAARAEPVVLAYRQKRVLHSPVGLDELEAEQTSWEPTARWSPNRLDALVHACRALLVDDSKLQTFAGSITVARPSVRGLGGLGVRTGFSASAGRARASMQRWRRA